MWHYSLVEIYENLGEVLLNFWRNSVTFQKTEILYVKFPWRPCTVFPQLEVVYCIIKQNLVAAQRWQHLEYSALTIQIIFVTVGSNSYHMENTLFNILSISI